MRVECTVCGGYGAVVWECIDTVRMPRAPYNHEAPEDECPVCGGCGTTPAFNPETD
jgi:hypothetical protein